MKLTIATPLAIVVEADAIVHLRAEDASGAFGILPHHADFLTTLTVSVITWRDERGTEHHAAVRGGMLEVSGGDTISVASPEAVVGDDLRTLEGEVLARFRRQLGEEQAARSDVERLYLAAIREIVRLLRPQGSLHLRVAAELGGSGRRESGSVKSGSREPGSLAPGSLEP